MENLLPLVLLAACPVVMGLGMWFMGREMRMDGNGRMQHASSADADPEQCLAVLQAERELIEARLRLEEAQRGDARGGEVPR